jgi:hypothetical protein
LAGRARAIDLKLRLALRVAALAAVCFLAVAAYALFDSDRAARAKVSRIAEIVARDISLQQARRRTGLPCRPSELRICNGSRRR